MPMCMLFVSSSNDTRIVFNPSAGAITDHSQSAKDIDPYSKSLLYVEDRGHRKPVLILSNGLSKPGERAHDRNLISAVCGIRTHNLLVHRVPTELLFLDWQSQKFSTNGRQGRQYFVFAGLKRQLIYHNVKPQYVDLFIYLFIYLFIIDFQANLQDSPISRGSSVSVCLYVCVCLSAKIVHKGHTLAK